MVGFKIKDLFNKISRQRKLQDGCDAKGAVKRLEKLHDKDPMMF